MQAIQNYLESAMNEYVWILFLIVLIVLFGIWGLFKSFSVFNSPDGERYRKMKTQGPFVPLSSEEIEKDEQRKSQRK